MRWNPLRSLPLRSLPLRSLPKFASIGTVLIGCIVLLGWVAHLELLKSLLPGLPTMKVNTALGLILGGVSLWSYLDSTVERSPPWARSLSLGSAGAIGILGGLVLIEYGFNLNLGLSELLIRDTSPQIGTAAPGRMAGETAFNFLLLGSGLIFLNRGCFSIAQSAAAIGFLVALLALVGYAFQIKEFYSLSPGTSMALHTSLTFLILTLGVLFGRPDRGWISIITSPYLGGITARRLLPVIIGVPLLLGGSILFAYRQNLLAIEVGVTGRAILNIAILGSVSLWNARFLNRLDAKQQQTELALRQLNEQLESRVADRTANLAQDINERQQTEAALRLSEQRYASLAATAPVGIFRTTVDGACVYVNDRWCQIAGFSAAAALGTGWTNALHPADRDRVAAAWYEAAQTRTMFRLEYRFQRPDGSVSWVFGQATAEGTAEGHVIGYVGTITDISEAKREENDRKQAAAALRLSEERYRSLVEATAYSVWVIDGAGRTIEAAPNWIETTGQVPQVGAAWDWLEQIHPDDRDRVRQRLSHCMATGELYEIEQRVQSHTGEYRLYCVKGAPVYNDDGSIREWVGTLNDITEAKREERDRRQAEAALRQSEITKRALIQAIPDLLIRMREDGTQLELINQGSVHLAGDQSDFVGSKIMERLPTEVALERLRCATQALATGQVQFHEYQLTLDGQPYYEEARIVPLHANEVLMMVRDITERKQAEENLRQNEAKLRSVLENMPMLLDALDERGHIIVWNQECERVTGYTAAEVIQNPTALELLYPDPEYRQQMLQNWQAQGNDYRNWEWDLVSKSGAVKTIAWSNISDRFPIPGWATWGVGIDLTSRKQAELEIVRLNQTLEQRVNQRTAELTTANQELEAFSYSVSHDLRSPLRGIDGFSQILQERYADQLDDKGKHYLTRIRAGTQRMGELIDDLLRLSRVTRAEMQCGPVHLSAIAEEICQSLNQPDHPVEWVIAAEIWATGDARLLQIVLENLLNNAWKFTSTQAHARIELGTLSTGTPPRLTYFIRDNGVGFDMTYTNKLFKAFQRLHSEREFPGTGIGLAIVERVIHRHGGTVWAEGVLGQGATFYFTLG